MKKSTQLFLLLLSVGMYGCVNETAPVPAELVENKAFATTDSIVAEEAEIDTSLTFLIGDGYAEMRKGELIMVHAALLPETPLEGTARKWDAAYSLANCLVVLREVSVPGDFCAVPQVKEVRIYTATGDSVIINDKQESKAFSGFPLTCNFEGGGMEVDDSSWGVLMSEAEGNWYGFTVLRSDGTISETEFAGFDNNSDETINSGLGPVSTPDNQLLYPRAFRSETGDTIRDMLISADGTYEFIESKSPI